MKTQSIEFWYTKGDLCESFGDLWEEGVLINKKPNQGIQKRKEGTARTTFYKIVELLIFGGSSGIKYISKRPIICVRYFIDIKQCIFVLYFQK